ncbi:hypothetical protein ACFXQA_12020 [Microbacterium sp. P07]|uniref:hypothetical protein n=1 Tax=Microbacterium sp. P07 TaxID=3366952 RepID=UPI0037456687
MTDENLDDRTLADTTAEETAAEVTDEPGTEAPPQYGVGPFSIREVALGGVWLIAFVVSFFPVNLIVGPAAALIGGANVWVSGLSWILAIGVPTVAVFLVILRRLSPQGIPRVGSLGIDQFASVAFSVAAIFWLQLVWETVAISVETGAWVRSWVIWVELFVMLAGVVLTVFAPFLPALEQDFQDRREIPAHRNARPIRPVVARPKAPRPARPEPAPVAAAPAGEYSPQPYDSGVVHDPSAAPAPAAEHETGSYDMGSYGASPSDTGAQVSPTADTGSYGTDVFAPLDNSEPQTATEEWAPASDDTVRTTQIPAQSQQAFWALAPVERDIVDDYGSPLFRIGPTAWALVIEDRGEAFVVRHEDGRVGFLHDLTGVTRG